MKNIAHTEYKDLKNIKNYLFAFCFNENAIFKDFVEKFDNKTGLELIVVSFEEDDYTPSISHFRYVGDDGLENEIFTPLLTSDHLNKAINNARNRDENKNTILNQEKDILNNIMEEFRVDK